MQRESNGDEKDQREGQSKREDEVCFSDEEWGS